MNEDDNDAVRRNGSAAHERAYLLRRADDHRKLASSAVDPNIQATHLLMQALYEQRAEGPALVHQD